MIGLSPGFRNPTEMTFNPCARIGSMRSLLDRARLRVRAQHQRHIRTVDVCIQQTHLVPHLRKRQRKIHR